MKTKIAVAILVTLILISACAAQRTDQKAILRNPQSPIPVGHYSLHYLPEKEATPQMSQMSSPPADRAGLFDVCHGRAQKIRPRFGRSLSYPCRESKDKG